MYQVARDLSQLIITHGPDRPWVAGQAIFVVRDGQVAAAGIVDSANDQAALVNVLRRGASAPKVGDEVIFAPATAQVWKLGKTDGDFWSNQPLGSAWRVGDTACAERGGQTFACGEVVETGRELALIRLRNALIWPELGDFVRQAYIETDVLGIEGNSAVVPQGKLESWFEGETACTAAEDGRQLCGTINGTGDNAARITLDGGAEGWHVGSKVRSGARNAFVYQIAADQSAMVLTQSFAKPWAVGDSVCAQRARQELACGTVSTTNEQGALVFIDLRSDYEVAPGDAARPAGSGLGNLLKHSVQKQAPAAAPEPEAPVASVATAVAPAGLSSDPVPASPVVAQAPKPAAPGGRSNFGFGINYTFPQVQYHYGFAERYSFGINLLLMNYPVGPGNSLRGAGVLFSLNYYGEALYQGLWIQAAAGPYTLKLTNGSAEQDFKSLGAIGQVGWKWKWGDSGNFGFGVGVHYLLKFPRTSPLGSGFGGLLPALTIEVGFSS